MKALATLTLIALTACAASDDPADGGFLNGVAGIAGGGYDDRIAQREAEIDEGRAEQATLRGQLASLTGQLSDLKTRIIRQRAALAAQGVRLSAASEGRVQRVLADDPQSADPAARAAALRRAIAEARELSEALEQLAG